MGTLVHDTGFADTLPAHHVITSYGVSEPISDAHLRAHVARTTHSGMVNHRGWRQRVADRLVALFLNTRKSKKHG
jgi:hypothetical protein